MVEATHTAESHIELDPAPPVQTAEDVAEALALSAGYVRRMFTGSLARVDTVDLGDGREAARHNGNIVERIRLDDTLRVELGLSGRRHGYILWGESVPRGEVVVCQAEFEQTTSAPEQSTAMIRRKPTSLLRLALPEPKFDLPELTEYDNLIGLMSTLFVTLELDAGEHAEYWRAIYEVFGRPMGELDGVDLRKRREGYEKQGHTFASHVRFARWHDAEHGTKWCDRLYAIAYRLYAGLIEEGQQ